MALKSRSALQVRHSVAPLLLLLVAPLTSVAAAALQTPRAPTHSGYLPVRADGGALFYTYYEQTQHAPSAAGEASSNSSAASPVSLWLQGGPGCASNGYGNFYELGPQQLADDGATLVDNPFAWNRRAGLLFIDQPLGTGYSAYGGSELVRDAEGAAADVYVALQVFFARHPPLQRRPLLITGESFAGKYIPALAEYILRRASVADVAPARLAAAATARRLLASSGPATPTVAQAAAWPPLFALAGAAIGNGYTAPREQVRWVAPAAYAMGLLDVQQRDEDDRMAQQARLIRRHMPPARRAGPPRPDMRRGGAPVVEDIDAGELEAALAEREALLAAVVNETGAGTLLDVRREDDYDGPGHVQAFLRRPEVAAALGAAPEAAPAFASCNATVGAAWAGSHARSEAPDVAALLDAGLPVLLYQGQFDVQDGPAGNMAWLAALEWSGRDAFAAAPSEQWRHAGSGARLGYTKRSGALWHTTLLGAGHLVPHDAPEAAAAMIDEWAAHAVAVQRAR